MSSLVCPARRLTKAIVLITGGVWFSHHCNSVKLRSAGFLHFKVGPFVINKYLGGGAETLLIYKYPVSYQIFTY